MASSLEDSMSQSEGEGADVSGREALLPSDALPASPRFWRRLVPLGATALLVGLPATLLLAARQGPHRAATGKGFMEKLELTTAATTVCTANYVNCIRSRCCSDPNSKCFAKDRAWAVCKPSCKPGVDNSEDPELQTAWSCTELRPQNQCSDYGENCTKTKCCKDAETRCYYKDPGWAQCLKQCIPGKIHDDEPKALRTPWSCVTPGSPQEHLQEQQLSNWVGQRQSLQTVKETVSTLKQPRQPSQTLPEVSLSKITLESEEKAAERLENLNNNKCVRMYGNCTEKKCCGPDPLKAISSEVGCYKRDKVWSECRESCPKDKSWECYKPSKKELEEDQELLKGKESEGLLVGERKVRVQITLPEESLAHRKSPTLYCLSLMLPWGNELSLIRTQLAKGVGIFACDDWSVISNESVVLSPGPPVLIRADVMPGSLSCTFGGEFHTALNSEIFYRVWTKVVQIGRYSNYDWTVKMDPDAVLLPSRLRAHTAGRNPHASMYLNNCFEGLHGPIEVMSLGGMKAFAGGLENCHHSLEQEWMTYGEDVWLRRCFGLLGLARVDDYDVLREKACKPFKDPIPCTYSAVAFHPLKTPKAYFKCLSQATIVEAHRAEG